MPKYQVLKMARDLSQPFRPVEITDLDGAYHTFVVRYSGDYIRHEHQKDEFIYLLEGMIDMEIDSAVVTVRQGEGIKIPAGTPHRPRCKGTALALVFEVRGLQSEDS